MKNCIVKIINGVPEVFGQAGKDDKDSLVYIFEEEAAFNAAMDAGMIPVGTLIVKTYDEVEMAGGPFDDALSTESENAPQNKVVTNALSVKSSLTEYGMSKICPVETTDVTENNGLVLGASEKNPSVLGSLSNQIKETKKWKTLCEGVSMSQVPDIGAIVRSGFGEIYVHISDGYCMYSKMFACIAKIFYEDKKFGDVYLCRWRFNPWEVVGKQIFITEMKKDGVTFDVNNAEISVYYR